MAGEKLEIEIVFDDGSVKRGLANVANNTEKAFNKAGKKSGDEFANEFSKNFPALSRGFDKVFNTTVGKFALLGTAVGAAFAGAFAVVLKGDETKKVEQQFSFLTSQAGLVGTTLAAEIGKASAGFVDFGDYVKASQIAVVELGAEAKKLPQIMELARKVAVATGTDTLQNYQLLNDAIVAGSGKMLKFTGLGIDSEAAYKKFASSIGVTAERLTLAGRQQAILNEVLEKGKTRFGDINTAAKDTADSTKTLTVALEGFRGEFAKMVSDSSLGTFFTNIGNSITDVVNKITANMAKQNSVAGQIEVLNKQIEKLQKNEAYFRGLHPNEYLSGWGKTAGALLTTLDELTKKRAGLISQQDEETRKQEEARAGADSRRAALVEEAKVIEDLTQKNMNFAFFSKAALSDVALSWQTLSGALGEVAAETRVTMGDIAKSAMQGLGNGFGNAVKQMTLALREGKNGLQAFGEAFIAALGNTMVQMGQSYAAQAAVMYFSPNPVDNAKAPGLLGTSLALISLGTLMGASVGGGDTQGIGAAAGAGGGGITSSPDNAITSTPEAERQAPQTAVQVVVNGNVFDSEETGLRIVDILNKSFDQQGVIIRGAMA